MGCSSNADAKYMHLTFLEDEEQSIVLERKIHGKFEVGRDANRTHSRSFIPNRERCIPGILSWRDSQPRTSDCVPLMKRERGHPIKAISSCGRRIFLGRAGDLVLETRLRSTRAARCSLYLSANSCQPPPAAPTNRIAPTMSFGLLTELCIWLCNLSDILVRVDSFSNGWI